MDLILNGEPVEVQDQPASALELLRSVLGVRSVKDGCSPQGQCGSCTILIDGEPRLACVTPALRLASRRVVTVEGLDPEIRTRLVDRFWAEGASQCGYCTPGILVRMAWLLSREQPPTRELVRRHLGGHVCRCTGYEPIVTALTGWATTSGPARHCPSAARRAELEGGAAQNLTAETVLGAGGFAADRAPVGARLVSYRADGATVSGANWAELRPALGLPVGRRSPGRGAPPLGFPSDGFKLVLATSYVDPAYLELDAAAAEPGQPAIRAAGNGGDFGGKATTIQGVDLESAAAEEASRCQGPALASLTREFLVLFGPKRPPVALAAGHDGRIVGRIPAGVDLVPRIAAGLGPLAPRLVVESVPLMGPPMSVAIRDAGWLEGAVFAACIDREPGDTDWVGVADGPVTAAARLAGGRLEIRVEGVGDPLDLVTLRSYCYGAAHFGLSLVTSEAVLVEPDGRVASSTLRSLGLLKATDMPAVELEIASGEGPPRRASGAVAAAAAAAAWLAGGLAPGWPIGRLPWQGKEV
jgi:xanthine dehydrogenase small subunit